MATSRMSGTYLGIACMFAYVALYVGTNMLTKVLAPSLPLVQIALFRYAFAVPLILFVLMAAGKSSFRVNSARVHVVRGVLAAAGSVCGYAAIAALPLGDATALFFTAPLLVAGGAVFVLGERSGILRGVCIAAGFAGVFMIAQPHFAGLAGIAAGLGNASCAALGVLTVRRFRKTEGALPLAFTTSIVCVAVLGVPAFLTWSAVSPPDLLALVALGILGGAATILLNVAYQNAPAPMLAGIDFLAVPSSVLAGAVMWDQPIVLQAAAGCMVVVAAGLLNVGQDHLTRYWVRARRMARRLRRTLASEATAVSPGRMMLYQVLISRKN
jgi:drug/metabolite transporter (DMT)-like permease